MCGICGIFSLTNSSLETKCDNLSRMISMLHHRGPDQCGVYTNEHIGLGHARLSIIDLKTGQQPMSNEDGDIWIIFNGEVYNYLELREALIAKQHQFRTTSDTEVIIHLYEEYGTDCLSRLNGQFAFAIWDSRNQQLVLARDRVGIRPLFYTIAGNSLIFASEIKSIFTHPAVKREIDIHALDQIFTFWAPLTPKTIFKNISEVPPGHFLTIGLKTPLNVRRYWSLNFPQDGTQEALSEESYADRLWDLLMEATRLRLRSDVPVGAYLSGGLDSSTVASMARRYFTNPMKTFSIAFEDKHYDESEYQYEMAKYLDTDHRVIKCTYADIAEAFPSVIWHTEIPILRTAPTPLYLLSKMVRENNFKVVLTGEGADEVLAGYNIFKEAKIRRFWAKNPDSIIRPLLLLKLYPYIRPASNRARHFWQASFKVGLSEPQRDDFSHMVRWNNTSRIKAFLSVDAKEELNGYDSVNDFICSLPPAFQTWDYLSQAEYIESCVFLSGYLLSSQGDRMAMANSVEGRFPFLDHKVIEFCAQIPSKYKLKGLREKHILRKAASRILPDHVVERPKQPYMAPDAKTFFAQQVDYVEDLLSAEAIKRNGYFDAVAVNRLVKKCRSKSGEDLSARDNQALVGILSLQLLDHLFLRNFPANIKGKSIEYNFHENSKLSESGVFYGYKKSD